MYVYIYIYIYISTAWREEIENREVPGKWKTGELAVAIIVDLWKKSCF